jgi:hypothetical protein
MSKVKLKHSSGNSMSIAAPATNPASDLELKLPATVGTAGQVLKNSSTPGTLEFAADSGITEFDMWRVNSSADLAGDTTISANWERVDTEKIGTGLTESSGIFTFPSTGKWLIGAFAYIWTSAAPNYCGIGIYLSTNSGGAYEKRTETLTSINDDELAGSVFSTVCFDITNSSTARMKLVAITATTVQYNGHTNQNRTGLWATKLGDT